MTTTRPEPATTLGNAYTVERELGGGGMSRVYLATETALRRRVVVKVLAPELAQGISAERFTREIELAAALQDPHIVPVLAAGTTAEGLPYYTMPFVQGESLRARLKQGPVPLEDALRILRDMAEALESAHVQGVVHRDIKPENVLLAGRNAVVADFGIAKAVNAARTFGDASSGGTLTQIGTSLGTPAYMSPEQAAGDPTDHRTDLYAWGMVAYELLAGAHPFASKTTAAQLIAAQIAEVPKPLDEVRPGLPPSLGALVMRCIAKDPIQRPTAAAELLTSLGTVATSGTHAPIALPVNKTKRRAMLAVAVVAVVALLGVSAFLGRRSAATAAASTSTTTSSLAVLPFEHQGDSADSYLTDGITDEIRSKFTGVHDLLVIARASSNQYRATKKTPAEIAKELGVRYLLTGTVRVVGAGDQRRVLVRPELVEITADGKPQSRWGQPFDATANDVIKVQADIAGQVVGAMEVALGGDERAKLAVAPTRDPVAYDLFLRGRSAINGGSNLDPASLRTAIGFYEQALARDSTMAEAQSWLGVAYANLYTTAHTREVAEDARRSAERAIALDPKGAFGGRAMAAYLRTVRQDPVEAFEYSELAFRAAPGEAIFVANYGGALGTLGRIEEAVQYYAKATTLDPRSATLWRNKGVFYRRLARYDEARRAYSRAAALAPTDIVTAAGLVVLEAMAGDVGAARRALDDASRLHPRDALVARVGLEAESWVFDAATERRLLELGPDAFDGDRAQWALIHARQLAWRGDPRERAWGDSAARYLRKQVAELPDDALLPLDLAEALAYAGKTDEALRINRDAVTRLRQQAPSPRYANYVQALFSAAGTALSAGDREQALAWLDELRTLSLGRSAANLRADPTWTALRGDPRFEKLVAEWKP